MLRVLRRAYLNAALAAVTIGGVALMLLSVVWFTVYGRHSLHAMARSLAQSVQEAVAINDSSAAGNALALTGTIANLVRVVAVDRNGRVLAGWHRPAEESSSSPSPFLARKLFGLPATAPILHDGKPIGEIRLWSSGSWLHWFMLITIVNILACQCLVVASAFLLSEHMLRRIVGPLHAMVAVADAVRRERSFVRRVPPAGISELNELARDFNTLLDELEIWRNAVEREKAALEHRASHDGLTGLPNRITFEQRLRQAINHAAAEGSRVAVLYIDVDRFKEINDRFGHAAGDVVLVQVALGIRKRLREADFVARLAGDEFAVLIAPASQPDDLRRIADAIQIGTKAPIRLPDGAEVTPSLSIGLGIFPDQGEDADALMHSADLAMYLAKRAARNDVPRDGTT